MLKLLILTLTFILSSPLIYAGVGHEHGHDHASKSISIQQAIALASNNIFDLISKKIEIAGSQLDES
jgi:hypothetical protein